MNADLTRKPANSHREAATDAAAPQARRTHRERDFGIGYGSSSGYASDKRYTRDWGLTRFRCA